MEDNQYHNLEERLCKCGQKIVITEGWRKLKAEQDAKAKERGEEPTFEYPKRCFECRRKKREENEKRENPLPY